MDAPLRYHLEVTSRRSRRLTYALLAMLIALFLVMGGPSAWQTWAAVAVALVLGAGIELTARTVGTTVEVRGTELVVVTDSGNRRQLDVREVVELRTGEGAHLRLGDGTKVKIHQGPALAPLARLLQARNPALAVPRLARLERAERAEHRRARLQRRAPWTLPLGQACGVAFLLVLMASLAHTVYVRHEMASRAVPVSGSVLDVLTTSGRTIDLEVLYLVGDTSHQAVVTAGADDAPTAGSSVVLAMDPVSPDLVWLPGRKPPVMSETAVPAIILAGVLGCLSIGLLTVGLARPPELEEISPGDAPSI
jgi:hypothetical protein